MNGLDGWEPVSEKTRNPNQLAESGDQAALAQVIEDLLRRLLDLFLARVHHDLGLQRLLVGIADAGEVLDDPLARLLVEALRVARLDHVERRLDEHLDEGRVTLLADLVADLAIGRDRGRDRRDAVAREHVGDVSDATDVRVAVFLGEAEALREVLAHFVAVEDLDATSLRLQDRREVRRERALARTGESREPEDETLVAHEFVVRRLKWGEGERGRVAQRIWPSR